VPPRLGQHVSAAKPTSLFSGTESTDQDSETEERGHSHLDPIQTPCPWNPIPLARLTAASPSWTTRFPFCPRNSPAHSFPALVSVFHQSPTLCTPLEELLLRINVFSVLLTSLF